MKKTLWVVAISAFVLTVVFGVEFLLGLLLSFLATPEILQLPVVNILFSILSYGLILVLLIYLPPKLFKKKIAKSSSESLGLRGLPTWTDVGLAPVGYVATIALAAALTAIFNLMPWFNANEAQELGYSHYMVGFERGAVFVMLAIIAPIMEELIFRGWLYGKLRVKIPKWVAIFITSLLFGIIHLQWNVGITVFAMSIITCTLREITGSIYAGTLVHIINNSVAFYLVYIVGTL